MSYASALQAATMLGAAMKNQGGSLSTSDTEIISRLKFIGKIQKGEKVNARFLYTQPDGIWTRLSRTFWRIDNHENTLAFIQDTIHRSFDIIRLYRLSKDPYEQRMCVYIMKDLSSSTEGLRNLQSTYQDETKFCCDIDTLLQTIEARLTSLGCRMDEEIPPPPPPPSVIPEED